MALRKKQINFIIDFIAYIAFVFLVTTGVLMRYLLPPGSGRHSAIWGLDRHQWGDIHYWVSLVFLAILVFHLVLHWNWIVCLLRRREQKASGGRFLLGLLGAITILLIALAPLLSRVESTGQGSLRNYREEPSTRNLEARPLPLYGQSYRISGYMSLQDIEDRTGVHASYIIRRMRLPENTSTTESLGRLKRFYGFDLQEIREVVGAYQ